MRCDPRSLGHKPSTSSIHSVLAATLAVSCVRVPARHESARQLVSSTGAVGAVVVLDPTARHVCWNPLTRVLFSTITRHTLYPFPRVGLLPGTAYSQDDSLRGQHAQYGRQHHAEQETMSLCFSLAVPGTLANAASGNFPQKPWQNAASAFGPIDGCEQGSRIPTVDYSNSGCSRY